ncbi:MAG TPA: universal stress protein [Gemmatimonadaceae bacterium]
MRIDTMLVAVDFSDTAAAAARWAIDVFAPSARVVLLHVIDPPDRPRFARDRLPPPDTFEAVAREHASLRLRELTQRLGRDDLRVEIRIGEPYEQVAAVAAEVGASMVVIGPHGDRLRPSRFLGTTADRIARTSAVPVLVVTTPRPHAPKHILVPIDDAAITPRVMDWTLALAEQFDARATLLHVWSNAVYSHVASMSYARKPSEAEAREEITKEVRDAAAAWLADLVPRDARGRIAATVAYGRAGDVALEQARDTDAELIVLGRTGAGLLKPALLGSTTDTVLHGARCPVLVITSGGDESPS